MSGDIQGPGEKLWYVSEVNGKKGYAARQYGHTRAIYATSRKDAKEQFIKAGYKQVSNSVLTAASEGEP